MCRFFTLSDTFLDTQMTHQFLRECDQHKTSLFLCKKSRIATDFLPLQRPNDTQNDIPDDTHSDKPIVVTQAFNASIDKVWSAVTVKEEMVKWYFEMVPFTDPTIGKIISQDFEDQVRQAFEKYVENIKQYLHL